MSVARPPRNLAIRLASVETSSGAYLASLTKVRLYSCTDLSPCLRAKNSSRFLSIMSNSEVLHEVIPSDLSITLVLFVGRVPTPCGTLELKGREADVVHRPH